MVYLLEVMKQFKKIGYGFGVGTFLMALFFNVLIATPAKTYAGGVDLQGSTYGLPTNANKKVVLTSNDFTLNWIDANTLIMTFKKGKVITFQAKSSLATERNPKGGNNLPGFRGTGNVTYIPVDFAGCGGATINFDIDERGKNAAEKYATKLGESSGPAQVNMQFIPDNGGECAQTETQIIKKVASDIPMSIAYFVWVAKNQIQTADGKNPGIFTQDSKLPNVFYRDTEAEGTTCRDRLIKSGTGATATATWYELNDADFSGTPPKNLPGGTGSNCRYNAADNDRETAFPTNNVAWPIGRFIENGNKEPGDASYVNGAGASTDLGAGIELNCKFALFNPLNYFMCPLVEGASHAITALDSQINDQLSIPIGSGSSYDEKTGNGAGVAMYQAWAGMRNLALSILVIITLVMVISQAIGSGPFDAYTVKKVLPRILIAVIGISLSWQLTKFMIGISNDLGHGIGTIIAKPFADNGLLKNPTIGNKGQLGAVAAIVGFFSGADMLIILSLVLSGFIGVMIAFLVIAFRNILVTLLVITAPLAIILWVLPNTKKAWDFWEDNFTAVILSFPIIVLFITTGRIFAIISSNSNVSGLAGTRSLFQDIITFVAYFGPYFALPAAFRLAGGAVATVGGMANNRGKGIFDRSKKYRSGRRQHTTEQRRSGNTFKNAAPGSARAAFNKRYEQAAIIGTGRAGLNPLRMGSRLRTAGFEGSESEIEKFMKESTSFSQWSGDDAKVSAAKYNRHEDIAKELIRMDNGRFGGASNAVAREDAISQIVRSKREVNNETFQKARLRAQFKTGTGYIDPRTGEFDAALALKDIAETYGNDENGAGKAIAEARNVLTNSGQVAGVAGFGTWAKAYSDLRTGRVGSTAAHQAIMDNAIESASPQQALYGKPSSARAMAESHSRKLQTIANGINAGTHTQRDLDQSLASVMGLYDAMGQSSPQNARAFADGLMANSIVDIGTGASATALDLATMRSSNKDFTQMRKDYGTSVAAVAARGVPPPPGAGGPPAGGPPPAPIL